MTYKIELYPGYGTYMAEFIVKDVSCEQDAIEKLCSSISSIFFRPVDDLEEDELEYCEENPDIYMYVDSTIYDGKCGYLYIGNMRMEEVK